MLMVCLYALSFNLQSILSRCSKPLIVAVLSSYQFVRTFVRACVLLRKTRLSNPPNKYRNRRLQLCTSAGVRGYNGKRELLSEIYGLGDRDHSRLIHLHGVCDLMVGMRLIAKPNIKIK